MTNPPDTDPPPHRPDREHRFETVLSHAGRPGGRVHGFVNPPLHRGSTVLFEDMAQRLAAGRRRLDQALVYGTMGNATHHALEDVVAEIEGGRRCQIVPTGLAACTTPLLAWLGAGEHVLVPDSVYGPVRSFCDGMLRRLGVATTYYDPEIDPAGLERLIEARTRVLYLESPGSHSFEVQDVPALCAVARARGLVSIMDNTWGIRHFQPFAHGVDVSVQALTKYVAGHSDVLLGSVTVAEDAHWERVRDAALALGQYASPDDCWLALRGARTLAVRLARAEESGLAVASWLASRPEVLEVRHPALPGARGHALWKRDFSGACGLFGVVLRPEFDRAGLHRLVDGLALFGIGASWGGFESLVLPSGDFLVRSGDRPGFGGPAFRLSIGLEAPSDLIADLAAGLGRLRS